MMTAENVVRIVQTLEDTGVDLWLDGGWGVDALLGKQTRGHDDLDAVISLTNVEVATSALARLSFTVIEDELPTRFVVGDGRGQVVDFHTVSFDLDGGGVQQLQDGRSFRYPPEGFRGWGLVNGRKIRCLTPEVQSLVHLGYDPDEKDHHDMRLLHHHLGLSLPRPYQDQAD